MRKGGLEAWALAGLLLVHVVLGVYWSVVIPIWEAHDEDGHWFFVRLIATEHRLPRPGERSISPNDEMHQPPLYYILAAIPVSFVELSDNLMPHYNPYMWWGPEQGGFNRVVHDPVAESWPYHGTVLAIHLARWVSVLLGGLTLVFTFLTARDLAPEEPWVRWGATLTVAFWPQFRFMTAVINNDNLLTAAMAAVSWLLVRLATARRARLLCVPALAVATGVAVTSKLNGLAVLPAVVLVGFSWAVVALRRPWARAALVAGGATFVLAAVTPALLYGRSLAALSSSRLAAVAWVATYAARLQSVLQWERMRPQVVLPAVSAALRALWAAFGWNNVSLPEPTFKAAAAWGAVGLVGLVAWLGRRPGRTRAAAVAALALVFVAMVGGALLYFARAGSTNLQGRYFLCLLPASGTLLSLGWNALLPGRLRALAWVTVAATLAILAVVTPDLYIAPVYASPAAMNEEGTSALAPVRATFSGFAELEAYGVADRIVDPGGTLDLTLRWKVLARTRIDYTLAVQVFGPGRKLLGEVHRYPGQGAYATTTWQPGWRFEEIVKVPVSTDAGESQMAWVEVSYYYRISKGTTMVRDSAGHPLGAALRLGDIKVRGVSQGAAPPPAPALWFGSSLGLAAADMHLSQAAGRQEVVVAVHWVALDRPPADYTVSVQVRDASDRIMVQADAQPRQNSYPTSFWEPAEVIDDAYTLDLPADLRDGDYSIYVCLYEPRTMERLAVRDGGGTALANGEAVLGTLTVERGQLELRAAKGIADRSW